jgi:hypothetical protein
VVLDMSKQRAQYRPVAWWLIIEGIGQSLRERYDVPAELPPKLHALVKKLDKIEGNYLLRSLDMTLDHPPSGKNAFDKRCVCT